MKFIRFILIVLLFSTAIISCRKDETTNLMLEKAVVKADTVNSPGNFLAIKGTLSIKVGDTTYMFDAAKDSIAFINVNIDSNKYYGITAINKAHTMSFGISSPGLAASNQINTIAGSQLLFSGSTINQQYT
jgi:uncharacterized protein YdeI (BOF family)